jgi:uncharacterized protein (TIGR03083 family)
VTTLREYVAGWAATAADLSALAAELTPTDLALPTDCPGWTVHDVLAHCAAVESELAGDGRPRVEVDTSRPHIAGAANVYTERGVLALRTQSGDGLVAAFRDAVRRRTGLLDAMDLDRPPERPDLTPGDIDWDWPTLMRNRVIDLWVHEQDIRRAVGTPGHLDSPGARVAQETFASALPFIVAKRAGASPGATVVVDITGPVSAVYGVRVGPDGRGEPTEAAAEDPTTRLTMSTEVFTMLGAGRRDPATLPISVAGDAGLAADIVANMTLTM